MTEEVTDAMIEAGSDVLVNTDLELVMAAEAVTDIYLAMRSASNSPTTNEEVAPRAASDDVERLLSEGFNAAVGAIEAWTDGFIDQASTTVSTLQCVAKDLRSNKEAILSSRIAALTTPTKASDLTEAMGAIVVTASLTPPPSALDDEVVAVLFDPIESDAVLNLEGVVWDLEHNFKVDDGGVCVRSIKRVMAQLETVRNILTRLKDSSK